ncbi:MAG TPA: ChaN family lipoprotein [Terriglobales bacterium]|nr:ChaN family lipoprotein [Terriglobales bacterium]
MASTSTLGSRRHAAQMRALAGVERELRANDSSGRRKYLRDFSDAFRSYESIIDSQQLGSMMNAADIILIGDYHALPAAQRYAATLLEQRAQPGDRPVVLGVETIFSRHQHVLEEWWRREIDESELRERIRFEADWGYDWAPFYELLVTARDHAEAVYGMDCLPREDLRKIVARDRHAVDKIEEMRQFHPHAVILVLFGESHLAPRHLPRLLRKRMPAERLLTVLQNVDALYWSVSAEREEPVAALRVKRDVVCVFNSTPLEKYENYRLCLTRWRQGDASHADAAPTVYNLIDSLACFLDINRYSSHNTNQPKFLVDLLPEVYCGSSDARLRQLLLRAFHDPRKVENMLQRVEAQGSVYLPSINALYIREFQMMYTAAEAARFLHHACRGLPLRHPAGLASPTAGHKDRFYARTVENALACFGSRVLHPVHPAVKDKNGFNLSIKGCEKLAQQAISGGRQKFDEYAQRLGGRLGSELYDAYLRGSVSRTALRRLFLAHIDQSGTAQRVCQDILRHSASSGKKPCGSVRS